MIAESKLIYPPLVGVIIVVANILANLPDAVRVVLDIAALAILFAGFMVVGRLRAETSAARGAAEAWESERNAAVVKADRLEVELREQTEQAHIREQQLREEISMLRVEVSKLESRPTLDTLSSQIDQLRLLMSSTAEAVQEVVRQHHTPIEGGT